MKACEDGPWKKSSTPTQLNMHLNGTLNREKAFQILDWDVYIILCKQKHKIRAFLVGIACVWCHLHSEFRCYFLKIIILLQAYLLSNPVNRYLSCEDSVLYFFTRPIFHRKVYFLVQGSFQPKMLSFWIYCIGLCFLSYPKKYFLQNWFKLDLFIYS